MYVTCLKTSTFYVLLITLLCKAYSLYPAMAPLPTARSHPLPSLGVVHGLWINIEGTHRNNCHLIVAGSCMFDAMLHTAWIEAD